MSADEGKIQKNNRGTYSITFRNHQALSKSDIMQIFSKYGHVVYIGITGDETGYRFVHFSNKEEAERAVANADSHDIKLRSHKSKPLDNGAQRNNCHKDKSALRQEEETSGQATRGSKTPIWEHEVNRSENKTSSMQGRKSPQGRVFKADQPRKRGVSEGSGNEEPMPELVGSNNQSVEGNKKVVRNAAEIVVGNIPSSFGGAYFLHLFEKYVPIAMSHVKVVQNTGMRYCHVYFRCQQDAEDVERVFDGHFLQDRKLIVMRPYTLMKANIIES